MRPVLDFGMCITSLLVVTSNELAVTKKRDKPYDEHVKGLKLSTLVYQQRADMLMTSKLTSQDLPPPQFICQFPKILVLTGGHIQRSCSSHLSKLNTDNSFSPAM